MHKLKLNAIFLVLPLLSCGQPMPGDGKEGETGTGGERGAMGAAGRDAATAGSRLKPLSFAGADGSRTVAAGQFYDSERRERCIVQGIEGGGVDGPFVCAPWRNAVIPAAEAGKYVRFSME